MHAWTGVLIPAVVGIALVAVALRVYLKTRAFLAGSAIASGRIVEFVVRDGGTDAGHSPFAVVQFRTAGGRDVRFESGVATVPRRLGKGEEVRVVYRPERPEEAEIHGLLSLWGLPLCLGALGAGFLLFALGWYAQSAGVPAHIGVPALFSLFGIGLAVGGGILFRQAQSFLRNAVERRGVVQETHESGAVLVRFKAPSGAEIEFPAHPERRSPIGTELAVFYAPGMPGSARLEMPTATRRVGVLMTVWGVALIALSVFFALHG